MVKAVIIIILVFLTLACERVSNGIYISDSLPYRLIPEKEFDISQIDNKLACFYTGYDSSVGKVVSCYMENYFSVIDETSPKAILHYLSEDRLHPFDEINFRRSLYPGLHNVYLVPYTEDLNGDKDSELFFVLTFRDSIVIGSFDRLKAPGERWLGWLNVGREDYHYLHLGGLWKTKGKMHLVMTKGNRSKSKINKVDTLLIIDLKNMQLTLKKATGLCISAFNIDQQHGDVFSITAGDPQNNVFYNGFDDYHRYLGAIDYKGNYVWIDTLSGPEKYQYHEYIDYLNYSIIANIKKYDDSSRYLLKKDRFTGNNLIRIKAIESNSKLRYIKELDKICSYDGDFKITLLDTNFNIEKKEGLPIELKGLSLNSYLDNFSNDSPWGIWASLIADINGDGIVELAYQTKQNQHFFVDPNSMDVILASEPTIYPYYSGFFKRGPGAVRYIHIKEKMAQVYRIEKTPFIARIGVWQYEIYSVAIITLILPFAFFYTRRILFLKQLFNNLTSKNDSQAIIIIKKGGVIKSINHKAVELLDLKLGLKRNRISDLPQMLIELFNEFLSTNLEINKEVIIDNGHSRHLFVKIINFSPTWNAEHYLIIISDVTQIAEEQRRRDLLTTALMITHSVKSPLATAQLQFDELVSQLKNQNINISAISDAEHIISGSISEAGDIIRKISYIAKDMNNSNLINYSLNQLIEEWVEKYSMRYVRRGIYLDTQLSSLIPDSLINPKSFDLMIQTLCDNSAEAMVYKQKEKYIKLISHTNNGQIILKIEDNGIGMNQEVLNNIMNLPGYSTKRTGTGLGMQLVHKVCKEHGAELIINSTQNVGTTVSIILTNKNNGNGNGNGKE